MKADFSTTDLIHLCDTVGDHLLTLEKSSALTIHDHHFGGVVTRVRLPPGSPSWLPQPAPRATDAHIEFFMDAEEFARSLSQWLQAQSGTLPSALALDGKMIRDCIGTVTLAEHEDGSPLAIAIMDQKEGTRRCEQSAAVSLLQSLPALDGKVVTADALHCQKLTARTIVEKGGDYLLQIKANQPALLREAQTAGAVNAPLFSTPIADTAGSKSAACA